MIITDENKINEVFGRYVEAVFPSKEKAMEMFKSGKRLSFYLGIDPTGPDIHLGHATNLLLLKKISSLGHKIIILIGSFTAMTGDPTGKESMRRVLTKEEVKKNTKTYLSQVYKILPKGSFEVKDNSKWLAKMNLEDILKLARQFTVQQMIVRDMFQKRLQEQKPISVEEFFYPLMQGYDSVVMEVDGEVGGNDQTFNMLAGRDLVKSILGKEKLVLTTRLLEDPITGKKLMNKSEGRYISLNDLPAELFGKVMSLPDHTIVPLFSFATEVSDDRLEEVETRLKNGENPKQLKGELAFELVSILYGEKEAVKAREEFNRVFSENQLPEDIKEYTIQGESVDIINFLSESGLFVSKSEIKRLIDQRAVNINDQAISEWDHRVKKGDIIKVGPRKFIKAT